MRIAAVSKTSRSCNTRRGQLRIPKRIEKSDALRLGCAQPRSVEAGSDFPIVPGMMAAGVRLARTPPAFQTGVQTDYTIQRDYCVSCNTVTDESMIVSANRRSAEHCSACANDASLCRAMLGALSLYWRGSIDWSFRAVTLPGLPLIGRALCF